MVCLALEFVSSRVELGFSVDITADVTAALKLKKTLTP